ncbi:GNAT family N-acetyltransferase [Streptomyces sp. NPDC008150]|uniref:GNAT family N-acetyltransferase n=1 Tax=Streptomyces sp. NPDC008150 TaxID=3364816 RepID=UPI0036EF4EAA
MNASDPQQEILVRPLDGTPADEAAVAALLADYHLRTEAEKGEPVPTASELPERYRAEALNPGVLFAAQGATVLVASAAGTAAGCLVVTAPVDGRAEIKRLWTRPEFRGRGVASRLVGAALDRARADGAHTVALTVWDWRGGAVALYERLGFRTAPSWEDRERLLCMERPLTDRP